MVFMLIERIVFFATLLTAFIWLYNPDWPLEPGIVLGTICLALFEYIKRSKLKHKVYFPKDVDEFYEYYSTQTLKAKKEIWVTSDGYNMKNPSSKKYTIL